MSSTTMTQTKLKWYCNTLTQQQYEQTKWPVSLYINDPKKICIGECLFAPFVPYIPRSIKPNHISYVAASCNVLLFVAACFVPISDDLSTKSKLCAISCIANTLASTLDCLDGMHARATGQCSTLGAVLDWWFDAIGTALNATGVSMVTNTSPLFTCIGTGCAVLMFNEQMLLQYYAKKYARIIGVEGQLLCSLTFLLLSLLYAFDAYGNTITYIIFQFVPVIVSAYSCFEFLWRFRTYYSSVMWTQFSISLSSAICVCALHTMDYITKFQFALIYLVLSHYFVGLLVLYIVRKKGMPIYGYYFIFGSGVILIEKQFSSLPQITPYVFVLIMFYKNINDFISIAKWAIKQDIEKKKNKKK